MSPHLQRPEREPTRDAVEQMEGPVVLEFGASWCGYCQAFAPQFERELEAHPEVHALWIEDGPGRPLGRSFRVKLWPTLVFLRDGVVVRRMSRPSAREVREGLEALAADSPDSMAPPHAESEGSE